MKNTLKFLGIIALAVVIGFAMTACDEPGKAACSHAWVWDTASFVDSTETTDGSQGQKCSKCSETGGSTLSFPAHNKFYGTWDNSAGGGTWVRSISKTEYHIYMGKNTDGTDCTFIVKNPVFKSSINNNENFSTPESRAAYPTGIFVTGTVEECTDTSSYGFKNGEKLNTALYLNASDPNKFTDWGTAKDPTMIFTKQK